MTAPEVGGGRLARGVSLPGIVALGAGTAIGVSIFSVIAPGARLAGPAMLLALLLAVVPMILFGVTYAFMASALPVSGASYEWSRRFIHPLAGFVISWLRIAGSTAAMVVLSFVLVQYWSMAFELPLKPTMLGVLAVFFVLNLAGVTVAARGQALMVGVLLATCAVLIVAAAPEWRIDRFVPFLGHGLSGVLAAVPLMVSLFLGIETATEIGEEVRDGRRTIPLGIALAILLTAAIYLLVAGAALGVVGAPALADSDAPLLLLAAASLGDYGLPLILVSATVAIGTSLNALLMIFSRSLFAMGRSGVLPGGLARVHGRRGTPRVAVGVAFGLCVAGLLLPSDLVFLFLAVNVPTLLKYAATCVAATRVVHAHPDVHRQAALRMRPGVVLGWAYAGAVCAVLVILLGLTADWRPYAVLGGWTVAGLIYYGWRERR